MMPEDRRQAQARTRAAARDSKTEQIVVLMTGAAALLLFLLF